MKDIRDLMKEKENLIAKYSYYYSDSEHFVEEYLENYIEMDYILESIVKNIQVMKNEYNIHYIKNECSLSLENKKTKESYSIRIEF